MCGFSKHNLQPGASSPEHTGLGVHPLQPSPCMSSRQHHPAYVHFGLVRTFHCALGPRVLSRGPDLGAPATRMPGLRPSAPCGPCHSGPRSSRRVSTPWLALSASQPFAIPTAWPLLGTLATLSRPVLVGLASSHPGSTPGCLHQLVVPLTCRPCPGLALLCFPVQGPLRSLQLPLSSSRPASAPHGVLVSVPWPRPSPPGSCVSEVRDCCR